MREIITNLYYTSLDHTTNTNPVADIESPQPKFPIDSFAHPFFKNRSLKEQIRYDIDPRNWGKGLTVRESWERGTCPIGLDGLPPEAQRPSLKQLFEIGLSGKSWPPRR